MNVWEPETKTFPRLGWWGLYLMAFSGWLLSVLAIVGRFAGA